MISTHTYEVMGPGDAPLGLAGGTLTLDAGSAPHVQASIEVALDPQTFDSLDPRNSPRVRITASRDVGNQTRTFDLGVRTLEVDRARGTTNLTLASDEALLGDFAPLQDDHFAIKAFSLGTPTLRTVVNSVLSSIGSSGLAAFPANDASVTPHWDATNYILNPHAATNANHWATVAATKVWATGGGVGGVPGYISVGAATGTSFQAWAQATAANAATAPKTVRYGDAITAALSMRSPDTGVSGRIRLGFWNDAGIIVRWIDTPSNPLTSSWTRVVHSVTVPQGAVKVSLVAHFSAAATGKSAHVDGALLTDGEHDTGHFDGNTPDNGTYLYDWSDAVNASTSSRTLLVDAPEPEALIWKAGQSALEFLHPLVQASGLRLVCDENRVWTLRDEDYVAPGALNLRSHVNIVDTNESISRDDAIWFDARVTRYVWTDRSGTRRERIDSYALPDHTKLTTVEVGSAYPGPGRSEYAVRRAQGRGREFQVETVSSWAATAEQPVSIFLEGVSAQLGAVQALTFDLDTDRMTITTRTTDTPAGAVDLLLGTVHALTGTVNAL